MTIGLLRGAMFAAALLLSVSACSKRTGKDGAPAVDDNRRGTILTTDAGAGRTFTLEFKYSAGETRRYRLKATQTVALPSIARDATDGGVDRSTMTLTARQVERVIAASAAQATIEARLDSVEMTIDGALKPMTDEIKRATAAWSVEAVVASDGRTTALKPRADAAPLLKDWTRAISRHLAAAPAVFPPSPIGVGAVWRRVEPAGTAPARSTNSALDESWSGEIATEFRFANLDGAVATIESATKILMRGSIPKMGTRADVELSGRVDGNIAFDTQRGVMVRSRVAFSTETRVTGREIPSTAPTTLDGTTELAEEPH